ncbi:ABC transporter permease [Candidatus Bathyarchaeota archaeon]|nr:MAG: ABC transporter permease [Candidatus Bathyarchaeota archaeon]
MIEQAKRAFAICKKDIRIYYFKGPVVIYGVLLPLFLFLAFWIGRDMPPNFLIPGMLGMSMFFTASSVVPVIVPWETRMKTLERLVSAPISVASIILGDILASVVFGASLSIVPLLIGVAIGVRITNIEMLALGFLVGSFCFSSFAALLSSPPSDTPATIMMLSSLVKFPLVFISGVFIPLENLQLWGRMLASISPLTYFVDLARGCMQGSSLYPPLLDLIILACFALGFFFASIKLHERSLPKRL